MYRSTMLVCAALATVVAVPAPASAQDVCVQVIITTSGGPQNLGPCFDENPSGVCNDTEAVIGMDTVIIRVCVSP